MYRSTRVGCAAVLAAVTVATAGCAVSLNSLPLPTPGIGGDSYTITASFTNALNLPARAKVKLAGADVGQVESMAVRDYVALVELRIQGGVALPVGSTVELRSATPLGDVFVALTPPAHPRAPSPLLRDGDRIPLESTSAAATVEEILTTAALLVNGGVMRNLTEVTNGLGAAVGGRGHNLARLLEDTTRLVSTLAARSSEIRDAVNQTAQLTGALNAQQTSIDDTLAAAGPALATLAADTRQWTDLASGADRIAAQVGRFPSIQGADTRGMIADLNRLAAAFNDVSVDPGTSLDAINQIIAPFLKMTNGPAVHAAVDIQRIALGAVSDPNNKADPGLHLPDATDFTAFVGSLAYVLARLRDRVLGPGR
ncbi:MCE family protein [Nocardia higoensis]|uniref:MCE family protein n=2 Tax=Nocardia higoensis TaxID=228599 RepID=A0ABS0DBA7_9NOCA|nr:MCE family protein [Nocardia higoensis]